MTKTLLPYRLAAAAIVAIAFQASSTGAQAHSLEEAYVDQRDVETHPSQGDVRTIKGATATLVATRRGAFVSIATRELTPGNAYTLWWVVINKPGACEGSPCSPDDVLQRMDITKADVGYADGLIAAEDGTGRFTSHLPVGPLPQAWYGNGLDNPQGAEIHLVINDHGPLLPDMARSMLGSARGGCSDESLPKMFPASAMTDGMPGPNTCRLVQDVIFTQRPTARTAAQ